MTSIMGLIITEPALFPQLRAMISYLAELGIRVRIVASSPESVSGTATFLRREGAAVILVVESGAGATALAVAAESRDMPVLAFCLGARAGEREMTMLEASAGSALLVTPANHPLHAAHAVARILGADKLSPTSALNLQARQLSQKDAETSAALQQELDALQQDSGRPKNKKGKSPKAAPPAQKTPHPEPVPSAEDEEIFELLAADMKPRYTETRKPAPAAKPKPREFSLPLRMAMTAAQKLTKAYQYETLDARHLFAGLLESEKSLAVKALDALRVDVQQLRADVAKLLQAESPGSPSGTFQFGEDAFEVLEAAKKTAHLRDRRCITTLDYLEAITLGSEHAIANTLWKQGVMSTDVARILNEPFLVDECDEGVNAKPRDEGPPPLDHEMLDEMKRKLQNVYSSTGDETLAGVAIAQDAPSSVEEELPPVEDLPMATEPKPVIHKVSHEMPSVEAVEHAGDALLEGKLVAFPADTMFALAADATNPAAVRKLRAASGMGDRPLGIWIHTLSALRFIVKSVPPEVSQLTKEFWPGPLTILFTRPPNAFAQVSSTTTIAVRIPNHPVALSVLSMVNRPLAVTSIDPPEPGALIGAKQAADLLNGWVSIVLDDSNPPEPAVTTVVSAAQSPLMITRAGAISEEELEKTLGQKLAKVIS